MPFVPKRARKLRLELRHQLLGADGLALVIVSQLAQDLHEWLIGTRLRSSRRGLSLAVAQHRSQHMEQPGSPAVADCVIGVGKLRRGKPQSKRDRPSFAVWPRFFSFLNQV